jgi:hypothetical protein
MAGMTCALMGTLATVHAQNVTLYDGAGGKTLDQGTGNWAYIQRPRQPVVIGKARDGATDLDTTSNAGFKAGYSCLVPFPLDSAKGYTARFDLKVVAEAHGGRTNRAGCSVIVLGSDRRGVELAFWTNEVWAQTDAFAHATGTETHAFDTTPARIRYTLRVAEGKYTLSAGGATLLRGSLHNYGLSGPALPYKLADYLFIGDDTTSASAHFQIAHIDIAPASQKTRVRAQ